MKKKHAVIHCRQDGKPYLAIVTDGDWTQTIPVKNSSVTTVKKAIKQMHRGVEIWISTEVESE